MSNICSCEGLEGLVIKDALSTYEPGKRHWLKVKKKDLSIISQMVIIYS